MAQVRVTVDGVKYADDVEPRMLLVYYLRERLGKTGTVVGCDTSNCGACTVHLNGQSVKSCSVLAVQADGGEVTTIEGLARDGQLHPVQKAFNECHALQCGYCTPGMIMQAVDLLGDNPDPDEHEVREGIEGNLCRCTGYQNIVRAVQSAAQTMKPGATAPVDTPTPVAGEANDMTTTAEPTTPAAEIGKCPRPQGGRAPDHRPHPLHRRDHAARHAAHLRRALAVRARDDHRDRHGRRRGGARASSASTPPPTSASRPIGLPCAWPITPDQKAPQRPLLAISTVHFAGEGVAVVVARIGGRRPGTPPTSSRSTTTRSTRCSTWRRPSPTAPRWCTRTWAPTRAPPGCSTPARPAPAAASTTRSPRPRPTPTRRGRAAGSVQQRLIPAFMEPRSVRRRPDRRADHHLRRPPRSRTSCAR